MQYVFGIPGAKIDKVFNTLEDSSIETIVCRHEQNAAFIAGGIGRLTGKAGVAIATSGPGVSNLTTGLATATSEGDPMVALGGVRRDLPKSEADSSDSSGRIGFETGNEVQCGSEFSGIDCRGHGKCLSSCRVWPSGRRIRESSQGHYGGICRV